MPFALSPGFLLACGRFPMSQPTALPIRVAQRYYVPKSTKRLPLQGQLGTPIDDLRPIPLTASPRGYN